MDKGYNPGGERTTGGKGWRYLGIKVPSFSQQSPTGVTAPLVQPRLRSNNVSAMQYGLLWPPPSSSACRPMPQTLYTHSTCKRESTVCVRICLYDTVPCDKENSRLPDVLLRCRWFPDRASQMLDRTTLAFFMLWFSRVSIWALLFSILVALSSTSKTLSVIGSS